MTEATNLPASLTVAYVLEKANKSSSGDAAVKDPKAFLEANGVTISEQDSEADIQSAADALQQDTAAFWQTHFSLHPQQSRVKNWMWVHSRYRNQAADMLQLQDATKWHAAFTKFHSKIQSHSEFEDNQLFRFFVDQKIGDQEKFEELMQQHKDVRTVEEITKGLEALMQNSSAMDENLKTEMHQKLEQYVKDLQEHLDLEEKTLVGPWLQLTREQYKTYRSYLSWKYCFMY